MTLAKQTPGVYVEEISTLPPSVAEVSTAIPAFFGYTRKGGKSIGRVSTMLEYEQIFGDAAPATITATLKDDGTVSVVVEPSPYLLHHAIQHYLQNGGGLCYVVSVGEYADSPAITKADFEAMFAELEKEDEPTLVVLTDAVNLVDTADYHALCEKALAHCHDFGDRFAILDVRAGAVEEFRNGVGLTYLDYGAAYHPYLTTSLTHAYKDSDVKLSGGAQAERTLADIRTTKSGTYNQILRLINDNRVVLPPSAAIAGVYSRVDRERGVWKAPANVSLASTIAPVKKITNKDQEGLNVHADSGKSINAIRAFTGKGTLVWGARTLAGNDNEWRYVPVRRLFIMIEESVKKATGFAVFEPNDISTWLKVKGTISSFLYSLWERGALAGSTPEAAYFVEVGLGKTMTSQDILEGRMIVKIGVAAVRPAEFIVLQFSHKLQEA